MMILVYKFKQKQPLHTCMYQQSNVLALLNIMHQFRTIDLIHLPIYTIMLPLTAQLNLGAGKDENSKTNTFNYSGLNDTPTPWHGMHAHTSLAATPIG